MIRLVKATVECPHCGEHFHQIDGTEERALQIARDACDKHVAAEHADPKCSCGAPDTTSLNPAEVVVHRQDGPCYIAPAVTS